jgi:hypothetical protein
MGREGNSHVDKFDTLEEARKHADEFQKDSSRTIYRFEHMWNCETEDECKTELEKAARQKLRHSREDDYNLAGIMSFRVKDESLVDKEAEPFFAQARTDFLALEKECEFTLDSEGRAECMECGSLINISKGKDFSTGICPVCQLDTRNGDDADWFQYPSPKRDYRGYLYHDKDEVSAYRNDKDTLEKTYNTFLKTLPENEDLDDDKKKRRAHLRSKSFISVKRPMFKPNYVEAKKRFRESMMKLNSQRQQIRKNQYGAQVAYLVTTQWLSCHDEWEYNDSVNP